MTGIASILYIDGRLKQVEVSKALAAYNALTGITAVDDITEQQATWLCSIRRVFLPASVRPEGYEPAYGFKVAQAASTSLTHEGVYQSRDMGIPSNDQ